MNKSRLSVFLPTLALVLTACGSNSTPIAISTVVLNSKSASASSSVTASGEIVPEPKAQLSFPLTGVVDSVAVQEGDKVSAGQTLVTLDTKILNAKVDEAQAGLAA